MLAVFATVAAAESPDLLRFEHENLRTGETEALDDLRGQASLLLFFQPDCAWCLRQTRVIDKMLETCPHALNAAALGVHGERHQLKAELRRLRPGFPAYKTGRKMIAELQGVPATPVMLLADSSGRFSQFFSGYIPRDRLESILAESHGLRCEESSSRLLAQK